jgi:hypothetical protein
VTASANPAVTTKNVSFYATVTAANGTLANTGTVVFMNNSITIAPCSSVTPVNGAATCTTSFGSTGTYPITAQYTAGADHDFATSAASAPLSETIASAADATTTAITASTNPVVSGQPVTYTAIVTNTHAGSATAPTGTVTITDNGQTSPALPLQPVTGQPTQSSAIWTDQSVTAPPNSQTVSGTYTNTDGNYSSGAGSMSEQVVQHDTLSSLPDGYFLMNAWLGGLRSTNTTTAVVLKINSAGEYESICTLGGYVGNYYSGGQCYAPGSASHLWGLVSPGSLIAVPVA